MYRGDTNFQLWQYRFGVRCKIRRWRWCIPIEFRRKDIARLQPEHELMRFFLGLSLRQDPYQHRRRWRLCSDTRSCREV